MGHKQQHVNALRVKQLVDDGMSVESLAKEFGVTRSSVAKWLRDDAAPYWTECACEALEKRRGRGGTELIFCEVPKHAAEALITIIKSLSGQVHATRTL